MNLYVAYEQGVYRHRTLAFGLSEKDLWMPVLEYFMSTDDYHTVVVELLNMDTSQVEAISEYVVETHRNPEFKPVERRVFNVKEGSSERELLYTRYYQT